MTVTVRTASRPVPLAAFVASIDDAGVARIRQEVEAVATETVEPPVVELAYVSTPASEETLAGLATLERRGVVVQRRRLGARASSAAEAIETLRDLAERTPRPAPATPSATGTAHVPEAPSAPDVAAVPDAPSASGAAPVPDAPSAPDVAAVPDAPPASGAAPVPDAPSVPDALPAHGGRDTTDEFGFDPTFHDRWLPLLGFFADRYWRIEVDGLEHVPATGPVLVAANHSGAVPADAAMLATTLERRHPAQRPLRVLYDRFVDRLPFIANFYRRYGAVPASLANAERLLRAGEAVGIFPEGVHGLEKTFWDRYQLQPFRSGAARLALRTGAPIVPVAIVGAEEAYPVVARLYGAGALLGLPWIPVTPYFPLCGLPGALPLPTKWHIRFGAPITPPQGPLDEPTIHKLTTALRDAIQANLDVLLSQRRSVF